MLKIYFKLKSLNTERKVNELIKNGVDVFDLERNDKEITFCVERKNEQKVKEFFKNEFTEAFKKADYVVVTDIFSARVKDPGTISGKSIAELFVKNGINAIHLSDFSEISSLMRQKANRGDIVITIGAGDVNKIIPEIIK